MRIVKTAELKADALRAEVAKAEAALAQAQAALRDHLRENAEAEAKKGGAFYPYIG